MNVIETKGLTKVYSSSFKKNKIQALVDFNLNVERGVIFGLLGPNGAGKTTLVKLLLGITFPTAGSATIIEKDISDYKIKEKVGYLPENHKYPSYLKGGEVLKFFGKLSGMNGVNLIGRKEIRDILIELKNRSKTIFLNSHLLSEVELITDRVGILNKGKLLREGTVKEFTEKKEEYKLVVDSTVDNIETSIFSYTKQPDGSYLVK